MAQPLAAERGVALMPPPPGVVLLYGAEQIMRAAATLWPDATVRLGDAAPSVTSYVQRVVVDGRPLFAKCSLLGVSLVSVLRGSCGDWDKVKAAQAAYRSSPGALLSREMQQLEILAAAGLQVPKVAGYAGGVLFTLDVSAPTLSDLVAREPDRTTELISRVIDELGTTLRTPGMTTRVDRVPIGERSISATFQRKFNGLSGDDYLRQTGHGDALTAVVARLRQVKARPCPPALPGLPVIFGDLKPEHVLFAERDRLVFLDPGLQRGRPCADVAKLFSRTVLNLVCCSPSSNNAHTVLSGIVAAAGLATRRLDRVERDVWLRELATLWLMDTTSILTTYLCAPAGLPLPAHAAAVLARAAVVVEMLDNASASMTCSKPGRTWWDACLDDVLWAVAA